MAGGSWTRQVGRHPRLRGPQSRSVTSVSEGLRTRLRPVAAHLARLNAAGLPHPPRPADGCADADPELSGGLIAGQSGFNRRNHPLEDQGIKACPSMLASSPASMVNHKSPDSGIQIQFEFTSSRFNAPISTLNSTAIAVVREPQTS